MSPAGFIALAVVIGAIVMIVRGRDVRLVLLAAALLIAVTTDLIAGQPRALPAVVR
jgi:hypothetical protein